MKSTRIVLKMSLKGLSSFLDNTVLGVSLLAVLIASCGIINPSDQSLGVSDESRSRIAVCSAGIGLARETGLDAKLQLLASGARLSLSDEATLRGAVFEAALIGEQGFESTYRNYVDCISGELRLREYVDFLEIRRDRLLSFLVSSDVETSIEKGIGDLTKKHIDAVLSGDRILAHAIYEDISLQIESVRKTLDAESGAELQYAPE